MFATTPRRGRTGRWGGRVRTRGRARAGAFAFAFDAEVRARGRARAFAFDRSTSRTLIWIDLDWIVGLRASVRVRSVRARREGRAGGGRDVSR